MKFLRIYLIISILLVFSLEAYEGGGHVEDAERLRDRIVHNLQKVQEKSFEHKITVKQLEFEIEKLEEALDAIPEDSVEQLKNITTALFTKNSELLNKRSEKLGEINRILNVVLSDITELGYLLNSPYGDEGGNLEIKKEKLEKFKKEMKKKIKAIGHIDIGIIVSLEREFYNSLSKQLEEGIRDITNKDRYKSDEIFKVKNEVRKLKEVISVWRVFTNLLEYQTENQRILMNAKSEVTEVYGILIDLVSSAKKAGLSFPMNVNDIEIWVRETSSKDIKMLNSADRWLESVKRGLKDNNITSENESHSW